MSHNHALLVLLCWLNGANWELSDNDREWLPVDAQGLLDLEAAVAAENLVELVKTMQEGLLLEVLSGKMHIEAPGAACLISTALNTGNSLALRNTELTAIFVLAGACMVAAHRIHSTDEVDFHKVKEACREQLADMVDEGEFEGVLALVVNLGATGAPFIPDLLQFGGEVCLSLIHI